MRLLEQVEQQVRRRVGIGRHSMFEDQTNCFATPAVRDLAHEFPRSLQVSLIDRREGARHQSPKPTIPSEHRPLWQLWRLHCCAAASLYAEARAERTQWSVGEFPPAAGRRDNP